MKRSEQTWNRRCALEFAGQVFSGLGRLSHVEDIREAAEWALKWLEEDTAESPQPISGTDTPVGAELDPEPYTASPAPPGTATKLHGLGEAARSLRADVANGLQKVHEGPSVSFSSPSRLVYQTATTEDGQDHRELVEVRDAPSPNGAEPWPLPGTPAYEKRVQREALQQLHDEGVKVVPRNVPVEGDGSITPPVYRFYAAHDDPPSTGYILWREDTRNLHGNHRWSIWEPENERWYSGPRSDQEATDDQGEALGNWRRMKAEMLTGVYHVPVETRYDTEE